MYLARRWPQLQDAKPSVGPDDRFAQSPPPETPQAGSGTAPGFIERWISSGARATMIGVLILVLGVAISVVLALESNSHAGEANKRSFDATANDLSATVHAKLDAYVGLTRTIRAIATLEPKVGETRLLKWYQEVERGQPISSDVIATLVQPVSRARLPQFRRQLEADPAFKAMLSKGFRINPPGNRPTYCLTRAIVGTNAALSQQTGLLDFCAPTLPGVGRSPYPSLIRTDTDTGTFIVTRIPGAGSQALVAIAAAVYRESAPLNTVAERRAAVTGSAGTTFDSGAMIRSALAAHPSLRLALYHRNVGGALQLLDRSAGASASGYHQRRSLDEGWVLEAGGTAGNSRSATAEGLVAFGLGLVVTMLVFLLYRVLSRSRKRAWSLVGEKTGELEYSALHDPLTDLPNRELVLDRAEQILARARRLDAPVTALFVDVDGFKQINDRYGHRAGDEVLRKVGARLRTILRDNDTVGRIGGDEFVMLIDPVGVNSAPELVAQRILDVLRLPIDLSEGKQPHISVTASVGVATGRPASAEALLHDADLALYQAKAAGKDAYVKFEVAMQTAARDRLRLEIDLADALEADQFFLVYQPMIDLETGLVVGVEALLRWRHPTSGVIPPDMFIPMAEDKGMIVPIGRWVLDAACRQASEWSEKGYPLNISVNASARQLERSEFVEEVRTALQDSGLDPARLTIEITETVLMLEPDSTAELLVKLKELGVKIAVDDFGTGYSSLAYLRHFPVDSLKIDRTFINGLALSSESHALTHTLIQLGKALGLQTLAEGVEEHSQVQELKREGCDLAQGFLFARPLEPEAIEQFLRERPELIAAAPAVVLPAV